jgi:hypothetical protein
VEFAQEVRRRQHVTIVWWYRMRRSYNPRYRGR